MKVRINLLNESELRYQGATSRSFLVKIGVGTVVSVVLLSGILFWARQSRFQHELTTSQAQWKKIEPVYKEVLHMQQETALNRVLSAELAGWQKVRIEWHTPCRELQQLVPPTIQLKHLAMRCTVETKQQEAPPPAGPDEKPKPPPPPKEIRRFFLNLEGRASGNLAEDVVVQFVRTMRLAPSFQPFLESIKLQSLQRDTVAGDTAKTTEQADRVFAIEAMSFPRETK